MSSWHIVTQVSTPPLDGIGSCLGLHIGTTPPCPWNSPKAVRGAWTSHALHKRFQCFSTTTKSSQHRTHTKHHGNMSVAHLITPKIRKSGHCGRNYTHTIFVPSKHQLQQPSGARYCIVLQRWSFDAHWLKVTHKNEQFLYFQCVVSVWNRFWR